MIAQPTNRNLASSGIKNTVSFGIKEGGFAHIFNVLRNQLYSDKYKAVLREYAVNGVDAHIEAGCPDRPIEVTLPTALSPNLKIRDFGPALTQQEVNEIYAFYGESTKRNTNSQTGMLGIGSKSAFAYGDNFVINSFIDGKKHTYNAFIDPSQVGQIAKMGEEDTDEENGVEIIIPTKEDDAQTFVDTATEIFQHFKVRPIIKGQSVKFDDREALYSEDNWTWRANGDRSGYGYYRSHGGSGDAIAVMGNIGYPIDWDSLNCNSEKDYAQLQSLCHDNLILKMEIGDLEISASREQLQYTDYTIKNILARLRETRDDIVRIIQEEFDGATTLFEAKCLYGTINDLASGLYQFRELINENVKVKGKKVESDQFWAGNTDGVTIKRFQKTQRSNKLKLDWGNGITCTKAAVVIENDLHTHRGLMNRLLALEVEDGKKVFLIDYETAKAKKEFIKDTGFDGAVRKLSDLPSRKLNEFEGYGRVSHGPTGTWEKDEKHSSKVFEVDWEAVGTYQDKHSSYWTKESVDFDSDEGLYLIIDRFQPEVKEDGSYQLNNLQRWSDIKKFIKGLGLDLPKIVGVKVGSRDKVEGKEGWTHFFKWLKKQARDNVKVFEQSVIDRRMLNEVQKENWVWQEDDKNLVKLLSQVINKDGTFLSFYKAKAKVKKTLSKDALELIEASENIMNKMGLELEFKVKPTEDLRKLRKLVEEKYAMINHMEYGRWNWQADNKFIEDFANYINVIDVCGINSQDGS
jgi:hypothetical protein